MSKLCIVSDEETMYLATEMQLELKCNLITSSCSTFSSTNELRVTLNGNINERYVFVISCLRPNNHAKLIEHLLTIRACKENGATNVVSIIPHLPYSRSDKKYDLTGPNASKLIQDLIIKSGAEKIISASIHGDIENSFSLINVECLDFYQNIVKKWAKSYSVLVATDNGGEKRVKEISNLLKIPYISCDKSRISDSNVQVSLNSKSLSKQFRHAIILEDALFTGKTVLETSDLLKKHNIEKVDLIVSHFFPSSESVSLDKMQIQRIATLNTFSNEIIMQFRDDIIIKSVSCYLSAEVNKYLTKKNIQLNQ